MEFVKLEKIRKFFYEEIRLSDEISTREQIERSLQRILREAFEKKPLVKVKLTGKEIQVSDRELREIEKKYAQKLILTFSKELESEEIARKIELLRNLREQKLSIEEIGVNILRKNLEELGFASSFDADKIFKLLSEGEIERASNILLGEQLTLEKILKKSLSERQTGLEKWVSK